jgi:hypothetical protein
MQRAPKQIPPDGRVECTDTLEVPIAATVGALVGGAVLAYGLTHMDASFEHGGSFGLPLAGMVTVELVFAAGLGYTYAAQCSSAKRRGAERAEVTRRKAAARAEAGTLWKHAAAAARAQDCSTVRELDPRVRDLDVEFHVAVFVRDVAIARCLDARE